VYGYPIDQAVEIAVREIAIGLKANESLESVYFSCFGEEVYSAYLLRLNQLAR
jgi:O-acetyl-ADP-ribose deacetylase (regulator of RNase III)